MKVSEIMTTAVKTVQIDTSVKEIANIMCLHKISGLPVVDEDNNILGIISEKDLLKKMFPDIVTVADEGRPDFENMESQYRNLLQLQAGDLMTRSVSSVSPDMPIMKAASMMCVNNIRRIPVAENNKLLGIVSIGDVHKAIFKANF